MTAGMDEGAVTVNGPVHPTLGLPPKLSAEGKGQPTKAVDPEPFPHRCKQCPQAKARCVKCLIIARREEIDLLRQASKDDADAATLDDLWLLRYVLSYGSAQEATEPLLAAMNWRREHKDLVETAWNGIPPKIDSHMAKYLGSALHKESKHGYPLHITRMGYAKSVKVTSKLSEREILDWFMWRKEYCYGMCDRATRKEGLLVKSINVIDFQNTSIFTARDPKIERTLFLSGKESENLYPQMVDENVLINLPYVLTFVVGVARFILPKKMFDKLVCCPTRSDSSDFYTCDFVNARFDINVLPTFLGGKCNCPGGCVPGIPNNATGPSD